MKMKSKPLGLYVHIPFCKRKCNYCDFCSFADKTSGDMEKYTDALVSEILSYKDSRLFLDTVFFGGGTPSLLSGECLCKIVFAIKEAFTLKPGYEFTVEANPGTLDPEKLMLFKSLGVNRLSLGLQTSKENEGKILGRIHSFGEFLENFRLAREFGFDNVNVDLMYAIPTQTVKSLKETLELVLSLSPEHISAYSLILEEGTPLYKMQENLQFPNEDEESEMYFEITRRLKESGYSHYEISNYAKRGRESRHNLLYWQNGDYIGVGLSAHSYFQGRRFYNTDSLSDYLSSKGLQIEYERERDDAPYEYAMLALRTSFGLDNLEYKALFGVDFIETRKEKIKKYQELGFLTLSGQRLALTESGFYLSNSILVDLL